MRQFHYKKARATERAIQIIVCFIGVYAIAIINYPAKNFIVFHRYRAVSYKANKAGKNEA